MNEEDEQLIKEVIIANEEYTQVYVKYLYDNFAILKDYTYITLENIEKIISGDSIIYINNNGYPIYGGIFIKLLGYNMKVRNNILKTLYNTTEINNSKICFLLKLNNQFYNINFKKHIFYKKKSVKSDVLRNILLKKI
jgi:hypothetical protein